MKNHDVIEKQFVLKQAKKVGIAIIVAVGLLFLMAKSL